jgi:hypothetical protein
MSRWPEPENKLIPEGHYQFRLNREPEFRKFPYTDKSSGAKKEGIKIVLYVKTVGDQGEFSHVEGIPVWDVRYDALCKVLGVEHGKDIEMSGSVFDASVKHEMDKTDPTKIYARIYGIKPHGDVPTEEQGDSSDIPF